MESLERKSLLILGGSGFIGSHLADKAVKLGYQVDVFSLKKPLPHIFNKNVNYTYLDLSNLDEVKRITNYNYDYVVNLSGYVNHSIFSQGGLKIINTHFILRCLDTILNIFFSISLLLKEEFIT